MLEEEHLGSPGLVSEVSLGILTFLTTKRWIGQDYIEESRRSTKKTTIDLMPSKGIAMPNMRLVNSVQYEVR